MKRLTALAICLALSTSIVADEPTKVEVGKPAPNFTATGIDGKDFQLSDKLQDKDKHIVLIFSRANW